MIAQLDVLLGEFQDMHVILVPSLNDAMHDYVFPQPSFDYAKIKSVSEHAKVSFPSHSVIDV